MFEKNCKASHRRFDKMYVALADKTDDLEKLESLIGAYKFKGEALATKNRRLENSLKCLKLINEDLIAAYTLLLRENENLKYINNERQMEELRLKRSLIEGIKPCSD